MLANKVERENAAVEFKREAGGAQVVVGCANVVEEGGDGKGGAGEGGGLIGELLLEDCGGF